MAKVRTDFKPAQAKIDEYKRKSAKVLKGIARKIIVEDTIMKGRSPVKGEGRFEKYSDGYRNAIRRGDYAAFSKKRSPVNLKLSGVLLESFFTKVVNNRLIVGFDDELADIHTNKGAGKSKVIRKMLPQDKETFNNSILLRFREVLKRLAKQVFK